MGEPVLPESLDRLKWEVVEELAIKVGDVVMFWFGGTTRTVLEVFPTYATVTSPHTASGRIQLSLNAGQTLWRFKKQSSLLSTSSP